MPVRDVRHWNEKYGAPFPCHYGQSYLDWYADQIRKQAVRRIWPDDVRTVLDVGCGDGRFGAWVHAHFGVPVCGIDAIDWPGARGRLSEFRVCDAEELPSPFWQSRFDLALCVTSLPFMRNWRQALSGLVFVAKRLLVVENLQTPTPPWQQGLPEKEPIEYPVLLRECWEVGYDVERALCVNVLDRRWFPARESPLWSPIIAGITLALDTILARLVRPDRGRYAAVLFQRWKW